jgi:Na+/melibiose symporter-like transporter
VSTLSSFGDYADRSPRLRLIATRFAHYYPAVMALAVVLEATLALVGERSPIHYLRYLMLALLLAVSLASAWHSYALCERCAELTPADASAVAERQRWVLWLHHRAMWFGLGMLTGAAAVDYLTHIGTVIYAVYVFFFIDSLVGQHHRLLEPWCPWCHWDDGGAEEQVPTPPVPSVTADR